MRKSDEIKHSRMYSVSTIIERRREMKPERAKSNLRIRPLKDPVILYFDDSFESHEVKKLFKEEGILFLETNGAVEPLQRKPLVLYRGGTYQGLSEIQHLLELLQFWSNQPGDSEVFLKTE